MNLELSPAAVAAFSAQADLAKALAPIVMPANEAAGRAPQPQLPPAAVKALAQASGELANALAAYCPLWLASEMR